MEKCLWQYALARVKGALLSLHYSFQLSASLQDFAESARAMCAFVRPIFGTLLRFRSGIEKPAFTILTALALCLNFCQCYLRQSHLRCLQKFSCLDVLLVGGLSGGTWQNSAKTAPCSQFASQSSIHMTNSRQDLKLSIHATCTSPRLDFAHFGSGRDSTNPPLPSSVTTMTTLCDIDALTWAYEVYSEKSSPLRSTNSPQSSADDFAAACTFYTTFTPPFHHTECPHEDGILPPTLDIGAAHCLLPLMRWMTTERAENCKRIHLKVASGQSARALLHDSIIYCATVTHPLLFVGQFKSMLDLRFGWSDSAPLLRLALVPQICLVESLDLT